MVEGQGIAWVMKIIRMTGDKLSDTLMFRLACECLEFIDFRFEDNGRMIRRVFLDVRPDDVIGCYHSEGRNGALSFEGDIGFGVLWILNEVSL